MGDQTILTPPRLTLISDTGRTRGEAFFAIVEKALQGGVDAVLLREKKLASSHLLALASRLRMLTRRYQARLIIHTQADIAQAVAADGVHVAAADIGSIAAIRAWVDDPHLAISASCHHAGELAAAARAGADWAMLSPVFPTKSHPSAPHLGVDRFAQWADASVIPVVALGGINTSNVSLLGDRPIAVISAILEAEDPYQAARILSGQDASARS